MEVFVLDTAARGHTEAVMAYESALLEGGNVYLYPEKVLASDVTKPTGLPPFEDFGGDWQKAWPVLIEFAKQRGDIVVIASADEAIAANCHGVFSKQGIRVASPTV